MIRRFTSKSQRVGEIGENIAVMFLMKHGFAIVERNWSCRLGEIDIIAYDDKEDRYYFCEVKSRSFMGNTESLNSSPYSNLSTTKVKRMKRSTELYLMLSHSMGPSEIFMSLIEVWVNKVSDSHNVRFTRNILS